MPEVSVVVPVYNPGSALRPCIDSLLAQSLPTDAVELIFVDDGSTDATPELLDRLAATHRQVQVIHQENSGWAGKPRNVGAAAATGRYVQFVDQDDALGPQALERLVRFGDEHFADIVLGKVTSDFRRVPQDLFRTNVGRCSLSDAALIRSLTPHKMFRRDFLLEQRLQFAEGRRRLEDQLFMTQAYLATDAVAILADYPCYFYRRRDDDGNAGMADFDPAGYYHNLREVLDVIDAAAIPDSLRGALLGRFLTAMIRRLTGLPGSPNWPAGFDSFHREIRAVILERFPEQVHRAQPTLRRQVLTSMIDGTSEQIRALAAATGPVVPAVRLHGVAAVGGGWQLSVSAELIFDDGSPIELHPVQGGWHVDDRLRQADIQSLPDSTEELLAAASGDLLVRDRATKLEWLARDRLRPSLQPIGGPDGPHRLVVSGEVTIDPATLAAGSPIQPGSWVVMVRIAALGVSRATAPRSLNDPPELPQSDSEIATLRYGKSGRLQLVVVAD